VWKCGRRKGKNRMRKEEGPEADAEKEMRKKRENEKRSACTSFVYVLK
jgi:hypothetical protein